MTTQEASAAAVLDKEDLRAAIARVLDVDVTEVGDDTRFVEDLEVDSLLALEVVVALEKKYGLRLEESAFPRITSLAGAHEVLAEKLRSA
ncbi:acyl carrier protein [Kitasatospora sp. NPDC001539]|uniref:acyl carrier protein n=1 Tax=unclassified Kitasatospora TaxID=2633591 RepID=UPI003329DB88